MSILSVCLLVLFLIAAPAAGFLGGVLYTSGAAILRVDEAAEEAADAMIRAAGRVERTAFEVAEKVESQDSS